MKDLVSATKVSDLEKISSTEAVLLEQRRSKAIEEVHEVTRREKEAHSRRLRFLDLEDWDNFALWSKELVRSPHTYLQIFAALSSCI